MADRAFSDDHRIDPRKLSRRVRVGIDANGVIAATGRTGSYLLELLPELLTQAGDDDEIVVFTFPESDEESLGWLLRDSHLREVDPPFSGRHSGGLWRKLSFPSVESLSGDSGTSSLDACHSLQPPMLPSRAEHRILSLLDLPSDGLGPHTHALDPGSRLPDCAVAADRHRGG